MSKIVGLSFTVILKTQFSVFYRLFSLSCKFLTPKKCYTGILGLREVEVKPKNSINIFDWYFL